MFNAIYHSPIGQLTLTGDENYIYRLSFPTEPAPLLALRNDLPVFQKAFSWLDYYFMAEKPDPKELPLMPEGTPFQVQVWKLLLEIPYGGSVTYGHLANQICLLTGKDKLSAQAVGGAVGRNPIGIIIPCHRVLGAGDRLTGFRGGLDIKMRLLDHENIPYR